MLMLKFLPTTASVSYLFTSAPLLALLWIASTQADTGLHPPASISGQAWLVSVVGAAMGLTKIVMWVRGGKEGSRGDSKEIYKMIAANSVALNKAIDIQERVVESQKQIAEAQTKSLDLYARVSENMAVFKAQLENHSDTSRTGLEDLKDLIRDLKRD